MHFNFAVVVSPILGSAPKVDLVVILYLIRVSVISQVPIIFYLLVLRVLVCMCDEHFRDMPSKMRDLSQIN